MQLAGVLETQLCQQVKLLGKNCQQQNKTGVFPCS